VTLKPGQFGVHIFTGNNPMPAPCKDCPFTHDSQFYLSNERMEDIKFVVTMGQPFWCHKTVHRPYIETETDPETGAEEPPKYHRDYRTCAGAREWALNLAKERGIQPTVNGKKIEPK
jgi:hypothetical protein